ncbi:hypothetical protein BBF96_11940 [Anoxybacter fermentans]|uniref:Peptidase MA-like domain-containing protein n=1 Tax=Anoxybacter fermentans TaxID=1323375 RepID=A0A3Q9HRP7_9FIRM|nr:hypothetical protein [Anoxybacter fermentans]AZR74042.1 hypothetical protein BBF96_11940 [Anoxybacter fermentans]
MKTKLIILCILIVISFNTYASDSINDFIINNNNFLILYQDFDNNYINSRLLKLTQFVGNHLKKYKKQVVIKSLEDVMQNELVNNNLILYLTSSSDLLKKYDLVVEPIENGFRYLDKDFTDKDDQIIFLTQSPFNPDKEVLVYLANSWTFLMNINEVFHGETKLVIGKNGRNIEYLEKLDWKIKETEHYYFYYLEDSYVSKNIDYISTKREILLKKVLNLLNYELPFKIHCYFYNNVNQKFIMTGYYFTAQAFPDKLQIHEVLNFTNRISAASVHEELHIILNMIGKINNYFIEEGIVAYIDEVLLKGKNYRSYFKGDELNRVSLKDLFASGYLFENAYLCVLFVEYLLNASNMKIEDLVKFLYTKEGKLEDKLLKMTSSKSLKEVQDKWSNYLNGK